MRGESVETHLCGAGRADEESIVPVFPVSTAFRRALRRVRRQGPPRWRRRAVVGEYSGVTVIAESCGRRSAGPRTRILSCSRWYESALLVREPANRDGEVVVDAGGRTGGTRGAGSGRSPCLTHGARGPASGVVRCGQRRRRGSPFGKEPARMAPLGLLGHRSLGLVWASLPHAESFVGRGGSVDDPATVDGGRGVA